MIRKPSLEAAFSFSHPLRRISEMARALGSRRDRRSRPDAVPARYAGRWVAWTPDGLHIVADGDSPSRALVAAAAANCPDAVVEWIPPSD